MRLAATTDTFELARSSAADIESIVNYIDASKTTGDFSNADRQLQKFTSAATGAILAAPGNSTTIRDVTSAFWRNKHASLDNTITVILDANGTDYEIHVETLAPGEELQYIQNIGFFKSGLTAKLDKMLVVAADVVNATTSFADITGLTYPLKSGRSYALLGELIHANDAATTGSRFAFNIGADPTYDIYGTIDTVAVSVTASTHSAGVVTARDTAITAQTAGATANHVAHITGYVVPSADGTFAARCASEVAVANGITVRRGSWLWIRETDNA